MYVIHMRFTRRKILLAAAALVLVTGMALLLAGCFRSAAPREAVTLATNEQRVAYLESLGWQVLPEPVATMEGAMGRLPEAPDTAGHAHG